MKLIYLISLMVCLFQTQHLLAQEAEKEAIKAVIQSAYIDGLHNLGDLSKTEAGFHPGFDLLGVNENQLTKYPIYSWLEVSKARKAKAEDKRPTTTCDYEMIDITGNAAVAKIHLWRENKKIFTDYLFLYKFNEGWRIVSKIYYRIPTN